MECWGWGVCANPTLLTTFSTGGAKRVDSTEWRPPGVRARLLLIPGFGMRVRMSVIQVAAVSHRFLGSEAGGTQFILAGCHSRLAEVTEV